MNEELSIVVPETSEDAVRALHILLKYVVLGGLAELKSGQKENRDDFEKLNDRMGKMETAIQVQEAKFSGKFTLIASLGSAFLGAVGTIATTFFVKKFGM